MEPRMDYRSVYPEAFQTMLKLEQFMAGTGIDKHLYELIKIRASQINGCAFCLDMHTRDARKLGESEQRLYLLSVWHEVPFYTEKERAVLALTEAVTRISDAGVPQEIYDNVRKHVSDKEYVTLLMAINTINCWNRIAISTQMVPIEG
ncbi:carboxymuconolactone decarboxylase family protein [Paenibacillus sp. TAB 01]|uniref:carboxymuconolactone decarboxylase family protein n=1 Tax=Paenibacillus sp. TAB 01 TaxID=3368988 RepID=UPI003750B1F9